MIITVQKQFLNVPRINSERNYGKPIVRSQAPVVHPYNPSCSGSSDQEDRGSKSAWANSLREPILKKLITRKGWQSGSSGKRANLASVMP
jgi:hypothetical protein